MQLYFILGEKTRRLKVGVSTNFDQRLHGMRRQNFDDIIVLGLVPGDEALEREIHRELEAFQTHGGIVEGTLEGTPVPPEAGAAPQTTCRKTDNSTFHR